MSFDKLKRRRRESEVPTSSMADIAFLLIIFLPGIAWFARKYPSHHMDNAEEFTAESQASLHRIANLDIAGLLAAIALAFALAAAGTDPIATRNCIHLLAIGTAGGMILAMMSRVSLGHTGRPLDVPAYLSVAFASVILAALLRAGLPIIDSTLTLWAWRLSGALWAASFSLFLLRYIPVLCSARVDGKAG